MSGDVSVVVLCPLLVFVFFVIVLLFRYRFFSLSHCVHLLSFGIVVADENRSERETERSQKEERHVEIKKKMKLVVSP